MRVAKRRASHLLMRHFRSLIPTLCLALTPFIHAADPAAPAGEVLSLNEAIQRALAKNYAIKVSGFDAAIASARVTEALGKFDPVLRGERSEERRVGKECRLTCRSRWSPYH